MKTLAKNLLACLTLFASTAGAQYVPPVQEETPKVVNEGKKLYPIYLGFGSSLFGKYGFAGISAAARIAPQTLSEVNLGLGAWGSKIGVSFTTFVKDKNAWCPSIGFTRNSGVKGLELTSSITYKGGDTEMDYTGAHTFEPVNILHLGVQRQWLSKRGNRIVMELGYSLALNEPTVTLDTDGIVFNNQFIPVEDITFSETQQAFYSLLAPNGLMVSFVYQFGLGSMD